MGHTPANTNEAASDQDRLDQTVFHLDEAEMQAFRKTLDEPATEAEPNPGLDRLLAITPPWANQDT